MAGPQPVQKYDDLLCTPMDTNVEAIDRATVPYENKVGPGSQIPGARSVCRAFKRAARASAPLAAWRRNGRPYARQA